MTAVTPRRFRSVQLQLDIGSCGAPPRPIAAAITDFLGENLPAPAQAADPLLGLDAAERAGWYRLAGVSPLRRVEYEEAYRRRLARQYRRRRAA
jgi:hypothetical protein